MRCIYVSIPKWLLILTLTYVMFASLLDDNIVLAGLSMFVIFYVDIIGDMVCDYIKEKNAQKGLFD